MKEPEHHDKNCDPVRRFPTAISYFGFPTELMGLYVYTAEEVEIELIKLRTQAAELVAQLEREIERKDK